MQVVIKKKNIRYIEPKMCEYKAFEEGIQVNGVTLYSNIDGMGGLKSFALQFLRREGIDDIASDPDQWYSQQIWLNTLKAIEDKLGPNTLFMIGKTIPDNAIFPDDLTDIHKALEAIDIAYHINHRNKEKQVLYDPERDPVMLEGIGHYEYIRIDNNRGKMVCENPYPCDFDIGIIYTMAKRFRRNAQVTHFDGKCRKDGDNSCEYDIKW